MGSKNECSNCGEVIWRDIAREAFHFESNKAPEDNSTANAACTRAELVTVKGCRDCWFRDFWECVHPEAKQKRLGKSLRAVGGIEHPKIPRWCPFLLPDGEPNAGVRIVAIKEDRG